MATVSSFIPSPLSPALFAARETCSTPRFLFFNRKLLRRDSHVCSMTVVVSSSAREAIAVGEDLPLDYADWLPVANVAEKRRAGVLLHPTSLRGPYGIRDLGEEAFRFIDWLPVQVLPLVPPGRKADSNLVTQSSNLGTQSSNLDPKAAI